MFCGKIELRKEKTGNLEILENTAINKKALYIFCIFYVFDLGMDLGKNSLKFPMKFSVIQIIIKTNKPQATNSHTQKKPKENNNKLIIVIKKSYFNIQKAIEATKAPTNYNSNTNENENDENTNVVINFEINQIDNGNVFWIILARRYFDIHNLTASVVVTRVSYRYLNWQIGDGQQQPNIR